MTQRLLLSAAALFLLAVPAQAQLFGPSDEQIAHERAQDDQIRANSQDIEQNRREAQQGDQQLQSQIRDLNERVRNLTDALARATGANEELSNQLNQTNNRITQQERDFSYRLCTLSAQQLGADAQSLNCAAAGTQSGASAPPPAFSGRSNQGSALPPILPNSVSPPAGNAGLGRGPGTLGTLSGSGPQPGFAPAVSSGGGGNSRQFDSAINLLAQARNAEASAAFRTYADTYPDDQEFAPQALYWVGQIAFMRQDYAGASRAFAEQIKKYPKSPRAADSMLKMGQALVAQGQGSNACTAFRAITAKQFPNATSSTIDAAAAARKANNCR